MTEPLRITLPVRCAPEHAFEVWTARIGQWWPTSHSVSAVAGVEVVLQPRVGGRIFERAPSGEEHDWGLVTVWEPPRRLGYTWHLRVDRADATDVEIVFADPGDGTTMLEITHTGWERLGARGPERREANGRGWSGLLPHFVEHAAG